MQVIPHITNEIKDRIRRVGATSSDADVVISEIGGTVGDIESLPVPRGDPPVPPRGRAPRTSSTSTSRYVPFIETAGELKTKPTQHSVNELRRIGIHPDIVVCRSNEPLSYDIREKIALFADVDSKAVIVNEDVTDVYLVPHAAARRGLRHARLRASSGSGDDEPDLGEWDAARRADRRSARARSRSRSSAST